MSKALEPVSHQFTNEDGDVFEATRKGGEGQPWTIAYPAGEQKFYGTLSEMKLEVAQIMKAVAG